MRDLRTPPWAPGARFALAAVALALFGLLSMHGWGSHAGAHPMGRAAEGTNVMASTSHDVGALGHAATTDAPPTTMTQRSGGHGAADAPKEPDGEGAGLLGLCLAVLAGVLLGIALLLVCRGIRIPSSLGTPWPHPVFTGRERDPPDLCKLCVIRC